MFVTKNKKLPNDCTSEVKMDLFLLSLPTHEVDILFSLLTHPKAHFRKTFDLSLPFNLFSEKMRESQLNSTDQNQQDQESVSNDDAPWCINDILKSISSISPASVPV